MSRQAVEVRREDGPASGRYMAELAPGVLAVLTYRRVQPDVVVVDHTGVPPAFEGRGIALQLVEALVADARVEGFRIVPACSYVAVQFRRHPGWGDLLAGP